MAQSYVEGALLFSQTKPGGSARIQAIGGAQIALGGDYSSALSNPAGLGMYNRSEVTFTSGLSGHNSKSTYLDNTDKDGKTVFTIPGISLVFHGSKDKNGFLGGSFGVSMSRINDFQGLATFRGRNEDNSIVDSYIGDANGSTTLQFIDTVGGGWMINEPSWLAYNNYLIGPKSILIPPGPDDEYFTDVPIESDQRSVLETKGAANQWSISYGGNYKDIFFFGGGIGIVALKYRSEKTFGEIYSSPVINNMSTTENLLVKGTGINATVGFIVRPIDFLQIGASFTTPTVYNITDSYNASMNTSWKNFDYYGDNTTILNNEYMATDEIISQYSLTTPFKFSAGLAFISKFGFITGDLELTNPAQTKYSVNDTYDGYDFDDENNEIEILYKTTINYRIGAEYRFEIFRLRGGFGVQGNSYQKEWGLDNSIINISGGVGIRKKSYFIDLALINSSHKEYFYQPYYVEDQDGDNVSPLASIKKNVFTGMVTVGFIF